MWSMLFPSEKAQVECKLISNGGPPLEIMYQPFAQDANLLDGLSMCVGLCHWRLI